MAMPGAYGARFPKVKATATSMSTRRQFADPSLVRAVPRRRKQAARARPRVHRAVAAGYAPTWHSTSRRLSTSCKCICSLSRVSIVTCGRRSALNSALARRQRGVLSNICCWPSVNPAQVVPLVSTPTSLMVNAISAASPAPSIAQCVKTRTRRASAHASDSNAHRHNQFLPAWHTASLHNVHAADHARCQSGGLRELVDDAQVGGLDHA